MPQIELNSAFNQSFYTQLSQNVSDSDDDDSEDEVIRFQSPPRATIANHSNGKLTTTTTTTPNCAFMTNAPKLHPILMTPRTEEEMYLNYSVGSVAVATGGGGSGPQQLACTLDLDGSASASDTLAILNDGGMNSTNTQDDESIASSGQFIRKPMGVCRKICFCLSIFVCVASVVIFLWGLPCDSDATCGLVGLMGGKDGDQEARSHNWIQHFDNVEFKSVISVAKGMPGYGKNLIFMYRSDRVFENSSTDPNQTLHQQHHNGIIALMSSRGKMAWYDQMVDEPKSIDCGLLDVDQNGRPDCLIIDEYGQLGCINPVSGQWMWHISLYQDPSSSSAGSNSSKDGTKSSGRRKAIDLLDFPVVLPDIDNDSVNDLLLVTSLEQINHNNFLFVSGANGRPIGKAYTMLSCEFLHKLKVEDESKLSFNCINNDDTEVTKFMSLLELYRLATGGLELSADRLRTAKDIEQHKFYGQRRSTANQWNIYSISGVADLIVENSGKCPYNCTMSIAIKLEDERIMNVVQGSGMYGMVPAVLSSRAGKETVSGFVIKFWEWTEETAPSNEKAGEESTTNGPRVKRSGSEDPPRVNWTFVKKGNSKAPDSNRREKREATGKSDLVQRNLKEHVLLIAFNGTTSYKVINTSCSDVVQFCREKTTKGMNSFCQPDMNYQENSVAIADLDQDGNQELISFYSTFERQDDWKLVTYVQQIRLEAELMSLNDT